MKIGQLPQMAQAQMTLHTLGFAHSLFQSRIDNCSKILTVWPLILRTSWLWACLLKSQSCLLFWRHLAGGNNPHTIWQSHQWQVLDCSSPSQNTLTNTESSHSTDTLSPSLSKQLLVCLCVWSSGLNARGIRQPPCGGGLLSMQRSW